jgi:hypothetical protein
MMGVESTTSEAPDRYDGATLLVWTPIFSSLRPSVPTLGRCIHIEIFYFYLSHLESRSLLKAKTLTKVISVLHS